MVTGEAQQGPSPAKRRRRAAGSGPRGSYASRVCTRCKSKKHKCVLSATAKELPNSLEPIAQELRCSRCSESGAECILWEDEARLAAKRKQGASQQRQDSEPNLGGGSGASASTSRHLSRDNSNTELRNGLGAATQQLVSSHNDSPGSTAGPSYMQHSNDNSPLQVFAAAPSRLEQPSGMPHVAPAQSVSRSHASSPQGAASWPAQSSSFVGNGRAASEAPAQMTATQQLLADNLSVAKTTPTARRKAFSAAMLYSNRPVELLSQLLIRTSGWCSSLDRSGQVEAAASPVTIVGEELSQILEPWVQAHFLWHPDLPSLSELRAEHIAAPSTASALLLCVLYHITLPHLSPQPPNASILAARLATCLRREAVAVLMGAPASGYAIQGLMLLNEHDPAALLSPLPAGEQRGSESIVGNGLLATSLAIAKSIQLEQAPTELKRLFSTISNAGEAALSQETRAAVAAAMNRAALWYNLQRWRTALVVEALDISMPQDLREEVEDVLQVDVDEYMPFELNEAHQLRKAGRFMLHVRLAKLRDAILATDQYDFAESVEAARDHAARAEIVTRTLSHSSEQIDIEMANAKRILTPLLAVSPSIGVLMQAVGLELSASHLCLFRYSWSYVLFGVRASKWLSRMTGTKDFIDRTDLHPSIVEFTITHTEKSSASVEQVLLALTDVACAGASGPNTALFDMTKAAVAAIPMLNFAALAVQVAKSELDQKATMMANFRSLLKDASRHISLLRFAARCLRDMDPAVRRGDIDQETGIRCGNVRLTAASLVSSMAETMAEWKSLIDGQIVSTSNAMDGQSNNAGSSVSTPSTQGLSVQQFAMANPYIPEAITQPGPSSSFMGAPTQGYEASLDNMLADPIDYNNLLTDWITMDAGPSDGQEAQFDWASIFGFPAAQPGPSTFQ